MASLRDMQNAFADAVLGGNTARIATLIVGDDVPAAERVGIYRNNAQTGFADTLAAEFPIVEQLGGKDWFKQTAHAYQRKYPSRSGNLHHVGERFADYLRDLLNGTDYAYFGDVAALEWAYQEVLVAAECQPFSLADLGRVAPEHYAALKFHLHPATRVIASDYPILAIWRAHRESQSEPAPLDLDESQQVLIQRCDMHVQLRVVSFGDYSLLDAFARGATLEQALELATQSDAKFDPLSALPRLAQLGVFAGFTSGALHSFQLRRLQ